MVSLHGGHSGEFCEHAGGTLREVLEAAAGAGFACYGISEHAPRYERQHLYASELRKGYTLERLERDFDAYAEACRRLQREFDGRLRVLRGFETEVVPADSYVDLMRSLRERHAFDYMVGSVHHVAGIPIDESPERCREAVEACGGFERFAVRYYDHVTEMIGSLRPEVVAHLDLFKLHAPPDADACAEPVLRAAARALDAAKEQGCVLDLNTAGWRKGLTEPYPGPALVRLAAAKGVPFCFGDDSHGPSQVGYGLERARAYLLANGVTAITTLDRPNGSVSRREIPLEP